MRSFGKKDVRAVVAAAALAVTVEVAAVVTAISAADEFRQKHTGGLLVPPFDPARLKELDPLEVRGWDNG